MTSIRKAVIPAAGYGTRLRPLTHVTPKEMLPLGCKPTASHIIEELHSVGVSCIIFVVSPDKRAIREYYGDSADGIRIEYVIQEKQSGLADAILQAEDAVAGEQFIVALGDTIILSEKERFPLARLVEAYRSNPASSGIIVERVNREVAHMYGMVSPVGAVQGDWFEIDGLVEKPDPAETPSDYAIGGRYIFSPGIFDWIRRTPPGKGGELQITDSIRESILGGERVWCAPLADGEYRYDIGNIKVYCEAFTAVSLLDPELAPSVERAVRNRL
ncbi:MAG: UTP--glucose-1-phosphate uridylyltransferase [Armatimonadota bacterium]